MSNKYVEKIGFYGGSYDPPTKGHSGMVSAFLETDLIDRVVISPAGNHAFGKQYDATDRQRMDMVGLMVSHMNGIGRVRNKLVEVCHEEILNKEEITSTYKSLVRLRERFVGAEIAFLMGEDCVAGFKKWKNWEAILGEFKVLVHPRVGVEQGNLLEGMTMIQAKRVNGASGALKQKLRQSENVDEWLLPEVQEYIRSNHVYGV